MWFPTLIPTLNQCFFTCASDGTLPQTEDIPPLRTVVVADTRPTSDISILQAAMRSLRLHKNKADDTAQIVAVAPWTEAMLQATMATHCGYTFA